MKLIGGAAVVGPEGVDGVDESGVELRGPRLIFKVWGGAVISMVGAFRSRRFGG